jgi:hypothetical protein
MTVKRFLVISIVLLLGFWALAWGRLRVPTSLGYADPGPQNGARAAENVPSYHPAAPALKRLPATLNPKQFPDPINQNAYAMASKVKAVLYQQPCYCHCDKAFGHGSLLDCYTSTHAAECNICKMEAIYAFNENAKKKSAAQIREGIIKGESEKVDLAKYREYKPQSGQ